MSKNFILIAAMAALLPTGVLAEESTAMPGGLSGLDPQQSIDFAISDPQNWGGTGVAALGQYSLVGRAVATPLAGGCAGLGQGAKYAPDCSRVFAPAATTGKRGAPPRPRILSGLTSFTYGQQSRFAYGMELPRLVNSLRTGLRGGGIASDARFGPGGSAGAIGVRR